MVFVYVLESIADSIRYVGMTTHLENRLIQHNAGKSKFTKGHLPWKIIYYESTVDFASGRILEKYFKSAAGKKYINKKLLL